MENNRTKWRVNFGYYINKYIHNVLKKLSAVLTVLLSRFYHPIVAFFSPFCRQGWQLILRHLTRFVENIEHGFYGAGQGLPSLALTILCKFFLSIFSDTNFLIVIISTVYLTWELNSKEKGFHYCLKDGSCRSVKASYLTESSRAPSLI